MNRITGTAGEKVVKEFLVKRDHAIFDRNYTRKIGEIDLISFKDEVIHFVEVKALSYKSMTHLEQSLISNDIRPEEHVNSHKIHKLKQIIQVWMHEHPQYDHISIDVAGVRMVPTEKYATIQYIENLTL